uniref:Anoctamin n=1 Tax=Romanomermis culicivorax TaxID=13658 RepID=A0A915JGK8_ROMCU
LEAFYKKQTAVYNHLVFIRIFNVILPFVCPLYRVNIKRRMADIVQAWDTFLYHLADLISSAFYETRLAQNYRIKNDNDQYGR